MVLELNYGNAVTGNQRFSRPDLEARFLRTLTSSAGIKMFGLRRIGKSTLRRLATEHFEREALPCVYIDGQGLHSLGDLLGRLGEVMPDESSVMKRALARLSTGPGRIVIDAIAKGTGQEEETLSAHWRLVSDAIRDALKSGHPKPILVIDEFSYLIANMIARSPERGREDVDKLLASMREWRGEGMTMLLTGSIGLTGLARKYGLNLEHLNDLQPFVVPELTEEEAREFIREATATPSEGRWTDRHTDEFLQEVGVLYPCFLVRGLLEIGFDDPAPSGEIARIFADQVRPDLHADFYRQFNRRFKDYADLPRNERQDLLLPALKVVMETAAPCPHDMIACNAPFTRVDLALALDLLVEDGFINFTETADGERRWKPASRLAQLWWKRSKLS